MIEDEMQQAEEKKSRPSVEWFVYVLPQKATWFTNLTDVAISSVFFQYFSDSASAGG